MELALIGVGVMIAIAYPAISKLWTKQKTIDELKADLQRAKLQRQIREETGRNTNKREIPDIFQFK